MQWQSTFYHCRTIWLCLGICYLYWALLYIWFRCLHNSSKSHPQVPQHVWHIDHPPVLSQVLVLHGHLLVHLLGSLYVSNTYLMDHTARALIQCKLPSSSSNHIAKLALLLKSSNFWSSMSFCWPRKLIDNEIYHLIYFNTLSNSYLMTPLCLKSVYCHFQCQ